MLYLNVAVSAMLVNTEMLERVVDEVAISMLN
jgi:hypothetical protein